MRKENDYHVEDRILVTYDGDEDVKKAIEMFNDYVKNEILAIELTFGENINNSVDLNGHVANIEIKKA